MKLNVVDHACAARKRPIIQAPMSGTGTPALAAAVSNAGGLGPLGFPIVSFRGMNTRIPIFGAEIDPKIGKTAARPISFSARGGLEPAFRVLFSAIFHEFPSGISIGVAICGKVWNQNCSFFVVKLLTKFHVFWPLSAFHGDLKNLSITRL
jgi:hypothetical protein